MTLTVLLGISLLLLASPVLWIACINVIGLRRLSMRLRDTEDDIEGLRNKSRSLQTQVSKKSGLPPERELDAKIDQEISSYVKKDGDDPQPLHLYGREIKKHAD